MKSRIQFIYALLAFLAAEAIQITIVFGYQMVYAIVVGIKTGYEKAIQGTTDTESITNEIVNSMSKDILYLISAGAVLVCGVVFYFWYRSETKKEIMDSDRDTFTVKNILRIIILGVGCQLFVTGIMSILQQYFTELFSDYAEQMKQLTGGNVIVVLLLMIFVAPVTEELVFRGVILHKASRAIPFWGANLLQAMLFGLYHMNIVQGIYAAFIGFLLGLVCHKFKNIKASMLLHLMINTCSLPVALIPQNELSYYIMIVSGGIFTFTALLFILKKNNAE